MEESRFIRGRNPRIALGLGPWGKIEKIRINICHKEKNSDNLYGRIDQKMIHITDALKSTEFDSISSWIESHIEKNQIWVKMAFVTIGGTRVILEFFEKEEMRVLNPAEKQLYENFLSYEIFCDD